MFLNRGLLSQGGHKQVFRGVCVEPTVVLLEVLGDVRGLHTLLMLQNVDLCQETSLVKWTVRLSHFLYVTHNLEHYIVNMIKVTFSIMEHFPKGTGQA